MMRSPLHTATSEERRALAHHFEGVSGIPVIVGGGLQGLLGRVVTDEPGGWSRARLDLGVYRVLGGEPGDRPEALIRGADEETEFAWNSPAWRQAIEDCYGSRAEIFSMKTFDLHEGYECEPNSTIASYEVTPLRSEHMSQLRDPELYPNGLQSFNDETELLRSGFGIVVLSGELVVAAASTYAVSSTMSEVAIATRPEHRRRGLAFVASTAFIRESLSRGLHPRWSASNPHSHRLACKLGYVEVGECQLIRIRPA